LVAKGPQPLQSSRPPECCRAVCVALDLDSDQVQITMQARFREDDAAGNHIPGAAESVASVAATVRDLGAWPVNPP